MPARVQCATIIGPFNCSSWMLAHQRRTTSSSHRRPRQHRREGKHNLAAHLSGLFVNPNPIVQTHVCTEQPPRRRVKQQFVRAMLAGVVPVHLRQDERVAVGRWRAVHRASGSRGGDLRSVWGLGWCGRATLIVHCDNVPPRPAQQDMKALLQFVWCYETMMAKVCRVTWTASGY